MSAEGEDRGPLSPEAAGAETHAEETLRPQDLAEMIGQDRLRENLSVFVEAARSRGESLDHLLECP